MEHARNAGITRNIMVSFPISQHDILLFTNESGAGYSEPYEHHVLKSLGADILPRKTTVEKLVARMNTTKFLHLRGTPASGKTVLLKLIRAYLSCRKLKPVYVNWPSDFAASGWNGRGWKDFLLQETGFQDLDSLHSSDCVLLIDEGQLSYTQDGFWNETIKWVTGRRGPTIGLKIILAASFGSTGTPSDSFITPVHIGEDSVIELFPLDSSHPGIFLDPEEYLRLVENRERTCRIFLTDELRMFTMGHSYWGGSCSYRVRRQQHSK